MERTRRPDVRQHPNQRIDVDEARGAVGAGDTPVCDELQLRLDETQEALRVAEHELDETRNRARQLWDQLREAERRLDEIREVRIEHLERIDDLRTEIRVVTDRMAELGCA